MRIHGRDSFVPSGVRFSQVSRRTSLTPNRDCKTGAEEAYQGAIVETKYGKLRGQVEEDLCVFRGVPYAQAPVGDLRFRPPVPVEPWDGIYDATRLGAVAPQVPRSPDSPLPSRDLTCDEDCLFLNVYTPAADHGRRPVLFWIHGGSYVTGSGNYTDGTSFAQLGDVVVVTVNYRLGVLGFTHRLLEARCGAYSVWWSTAGSERVQPGAKRKKARNRGPRSFKVCYRA